MGATPQNDDDDELYDDTDVTEDDFAEFDIDEDEEPVPKQVMFKIVFTVINEVINLSQLISLDDNMKINAHFQDTSNQGKEDKQKTGSKAGQQSDDKKFGKEASDANVDVEEEEDDEDAEAMVEEEESEFSHFEDDEEFENYRQVSSPLQWSRMSI